MTMTTRLAHPPRGARRGRQTADGRRTRRALALALLDCPRCASTSGSRAGPSRPSPSSSSRPRPTTARRTWRGARPSWRGWSPTFVSVTYGAGGTPAERGKTIDIVSAHQGRPRPGGDGALHLRRRDGRRAARRAGPHARRRDRERARPARRPAAGVDASEWAAAEGGLRYSRELIELIRADYDFAVGAACFPEVHLAAESADSDLQVPLREGRRGRAVPDHPAVLRQRALLRLRGPRARRRDRRPDHPGHHADHQRGPDQPLHADVRRVDPGRPAARARAARRPARGGRRLRRRLRDAAVRRPAGQRRARHPLLHAQPLALDARDPQRAALPGALAPRGYRVSARAAGLGELAVRGEQPARSATSSSSSRSARGAHATPSSARSIASPVTRCATASATYARRLARRAGQAGRAAVVEGDGGGDGVAGVGQADEPRARGGVVVPGTPALQRGAGGADRLLGGDLLQRLDPERRRQRSLPTSCSRPASWAVEVSRRRAARRSCTRRRRRRGVDVQLVARELGAAGNAPGSAGRRPRARSGHRGAAEEVTGWRIVRARIGRGLAAELAKRSRAARAPRRTRRGHAVARRPLRVAGERAEAATVPPSTGSGPSAGGLVHAGIGPGERGIQVVHRLLRRQFTSSVFCARASVLGLDVERVGHPGVTVELPGDVDLVVLPYVPMPHAPQNQRQKPSLPSLTSSRGTPARRRGPRSPARICRTPLTNTVNGSRTSAAASRGSPASGAHVCHRRARPSERSMPPR